MGAPADPHLLLLMQRDTMVDQLFQYAVLHPDTIASVLSVLRVLEDFGRATRTTHPLSNETIAHMRRVNASVLSYLNGVRRHLEATCTPH